MGYFETNHQIGKALHKEYEAKYALHAELHDASADKKTMPFKIGSALAVIVFATLLTIISMFA